MRNNAGDNNAKKGANAGTQALLKIDTDGLRIETLYPSNKLNHTETLKNNLILYDALF